MLPPEDWGPEEIEERMGALNAIRLPSECPDIDRAAGANVFRVVFNCVFGLDLPLLPTRYFVVNVEERLTDEKTREIFFNDE